MKKIALITAAVALIAAAVYVPSIIHAAPFENIMSDKPLHQVTDVVSNQDGSISLSTRLEGFSLHSFQDGDPGKVELTGGMMDPSNRRYIYIAARVDLKSNGEGPFITKIYRYDLENGKLWRIYRQTDGTGFTLLGFDGKKLFVMSTPAGDNSPGPCWDNQYLADNNKLSYIDVGRPWEGVKYWTPTGSFKEMRKKAFDSCMAPFQSQ
ncbi:MAG: hypothetical protein PHS79_00105 [Patescibacteria group bacterium]|nr:hypothetical protein [Patescibacteria group bacterium]